MVRKPVFDKILNQRFRRIKSKSKVDVCLFITKMYRFEYYCVCSDGFGGLNCHLSGCGGNLTSEETDQLITMPDEADPLIGCVWNTSSPEGSRIRSNCEGIFGPKSLLFFQSESLVRFVSVLFVFPAILRSPSICHT